MRATLDDLRTLSRVVNFLRWRELYQFAKAQGFACSAIACVDADPSCRTANVGEQWANGESVIICPRTGRYVELGGGA